MATPVTSGEYTFAPTAYDTLKFALRACQVINDEETPTGAQVTAAMFSFNTLVSGLQASGIHVWTEEEAIVYSQPGQILYQLGSASADHFADYDSSVQTTLAVTAAGGASSVTVANPAGIDVGFQIGLQLDAGTNFWTTVASPPSGSTIALAAPLPSQMSNSANQAVFSYSANLVRPLRCYTGRRFVYSSRLEIPMVMMSRTEYQTLPNKQNKGTTTQFFFDPQTGGPGSYSTPASQLNLWPNPQNYFSGVRLTVQRPIQNLANASQLPDFPIEWQAALGWNLAQELMVPEATPTDTCQIIMKMADQWLARVKAWDREPEGIRFGVAMQPGYRLGV